MKAVLALLVGAALGAAATRLLARPPAPVALDVGPPPAPAPGPARVAVDVSAAP